MTLRFAILCIFAIGCDHDASLGARDAPSGDAAGGDAGRDAPVDASTGVTPLAFSCYATSGQSFSPNPCPAPTGNAGSADFCYRPQWPGVTAVDVYVGLGKATDWTTPVATLVSDGTGTFTATAAIPNGQYPYLFKVTGSEDNILHGTDYVLDQYNPDFVPSPVGSPGNPQGSPIPRTISQLTVPQPTTQTTHHITGQVSYGTAPQPCFIVSAEIGELLNQSGGATAEHWPGNYIEVGPDGTFDLPIADGTLVQLDITYPFFLTGLTAKYPAPSSTPSIGVARGGFFKTAGADLPLDPVDVTYSASDYAAMMPTSGTQTVPTSFVFTLLPTAQTANIAVISTDIAGNDPAFASKPSTMVTYSWNGLLGNGMTASGNYYWGTWQQSKTWNSESLLFEITY
jgi:hypothetical protein